MAYISVLVIDDFYQDPDAVRAAALEDQYHNVNDTGLYTDYRAAPELIELLSQACHAPLSPADPQGTGRFALKYANDRYAFDIHADGCDWGGVLFLNPPDQCQGGTTFFRHKETGLDRWPTPEQAVAVGLPEDHGACWKKLVNEEGKYRDRWEPVMTLPMRYNRLILFRGTLFHSYSHGFGDDRPNGRLTQQFFFNEVREQSASVVPD